MSLASIVVLLMVAAAQAQPQPQCRLSIPNSGGASLRPAMQTDSPLFRSFALTTGASNCTPADCEAFACAAPEAAFASGCRGFSPAPCVAAP